MTEWRYPGTGDMVAEARPVAWDETARMLVSCSALCGVAWAVLELWGERQLPVAAPVVVVLSRWFWTRHRLWGSGAVAAVAGSAVVFALVDYLRSHLGRMLADTLATEAGVAVALFAFTACSRLRSS